MKEKIKENKTKEKKTEENKSEENTTEKIKKDRDFLSYLIGIIVVPLIILLMQQISNYCFFDSPEFVKEERINYLKDKIISEEQTHGFLHDKYVFCGGVIIKLSDSLLVLKDTIMSLQVRIYQAYKRGEDIDGMMAEYNEKSDLYEKAVNDAATEILANKNTVIPRHISKVDSLKGVLIIEQAKYDSLNRVYESYIDECNL